MSGCGFKILSIFGTKTIWNQRNHYVLCRRQRNYSARIRKIITETIACPSTSISMLVDHASSYKNVFYTIITWHVELLWWYILIYFKPIPANICLFKVINRNTKKMCGICSKLTIKTTEKLKWHCSMLLCFF